MFDAGVLAGLFAVSGCCCVLHACILADLSGTASRCSLPQPLPAPADGVVEAEGRTFLELEDLTRNYRRPSIIDIKVGFRTWYPSASQAYIERCRCVCWLCESRAVGECRLSA